MKISPAKSRPAGPIPPPMDLHRFELIMLWVVGRVEEGVGGSRGEWEGGRGCVYSPHQTVQEVRWGFKYIACIYQRVANVSFSQVMGFGFGGFRNPPFKKKWTKPDESNTRSARAFLYYKRAAVTLFDQHSKEMDAKYKVILAKTHYSRF